MKTVTYHKVSRSWYEHFWSNSEYACRFNKQKLEISNKLHDSWYCLMLFLSLLSFNLDALESNQFSDIYINCSSNLTVTFLFNFSNLMILNWQVLDEKSMNSCNRADETNYWDHIIINSRSHFINSSSKLRIVLSLIKVIKL